MFWWHLQSLWILTDFYCLLHTSSYSLHSPSTCSRIHWHNGISLVHAYAHVQFFINRAGQISQNVRLYVFCTIMRGHFNIYVYNKIYGGKNKTLHDYFAWSTLADDGFSPFSVIDGQNFTQCAE